MYFQNVVNQNNVQVEGATSSINEMMYNLWNLICKFAE